MPVVKGNMKPGRGGLDDGSVTPTRLPAIMLGMSTTAVHRPDWFVDVLSRIWRRWQRR